MQFVIDFGLLSTTIFVFVATALSICILYVTDVYARGVNVNLTLLTSNRGALATDAVAFGVPC